MGGVDSILIEGRGYAMPIKGLSLVDAYPMDQQAYDCELMLFLHNYHLTRLPLKWNTSGLAGMVDRWYWKKYPHLRRLGGSSAAKPFETRQVREEAAVQRRYRVPLGFRSRRLFTNHWKSISSILQNLTNIEHLVYSRRDELKTDTSKSMDPICGRTTMDNLLVSS